MAGRQSFISLDGMGSRVQVEVFILVMMAVKCAGDTGKLGKGLNGDGW